MNGIAGRPGGIFRRGCRVVGRAGPANERIQGLKTTAAGCLSVPQPQLAESRQLTNDAMCQEETLRQRRRSAFLRIGLGAR